MELMRRRRVAFAQAGYRAPVGESALSAAVAWALDALADMLLRHAERNAAVTLRSGEIQQEALEIYKDIVGILQLQFGKEHEYVATVRSKAGRVEISLR